MTLIEFIQEKKFMGFDKIYVKPNIPAKLISNVVGAYSVDVNPKEILILIDDTVFGSAKDGAVICTERLVVREMFSDAKSYSYRSIDDISCEDRKIYINNNQAIKFNIPEKNSLNELFGILNEWNSFHKVSSDNTVSVNDEVRSVDGFPDFGSLLCEAAGKIVSSNVYVRPDIPRKKLKSAVESYGNGISEDEVIVLIDDTAFGGAKDGVLITGSSIYVKIFTESLRCYNWKSIDSVSVEKNTIYINQIASGKLVQVKGKELIQFFHKINDFLSKKEPADKIIVPSSQAGFEREPIVQTDALETPIVQEEIELIIQAVEAEQLETVAQASHPEIMANMATLTKVEEKQGLTAKDKLISYISIAIEQNKSKIMPFVKSSAGDLSLSALREDENIEKLARFIYNFLPGIVRFALKEDIFIQFVLDNRSKLLDKLLESEGVQELKIIATVDLEEEQYYESQIAELLGCDEPSKGGGQYVLDILNEVVFRISKITERQTVNKNLRDVSVDAEHRKIGQLVISNITVLNRHLKSIQDYPVDHVDRQFLHTFTMMCGFGFNKIEESVRAESKVKFVYGVMFILTLNCYAKLSSGRLNEGDFKEYLDCFGLFLNVSSKESLNGMVRDMMDLYKNEARSGALGVDSVVELLRVASAEAERWGATLSYNCLPHENDFEEKWRGLLD